MQVGRAALGPSLLPMREVVAGLPAAPVGDVAFVVVVGTDALPAGGDLVDVPPKDAMSVILERGRSPLTVHDGIALTTVRPDLLRAGSRYSLLGSRCGDQRVPAIWVSERRPRLGWCWNVAPHTWLGSASCARRIGPRG